MNKLLRSNKSDVILEKILLFILLAIALPYALVDFVFPVLGWGSRTISEATFNEWILFSEFILHMLGLKSESVTLNPSGIFPPIPFALSMLAAICYLYALLALLIYFVQSVNAAKQNKGFPFPKSAKILGALGAVSLILCSATLPHPRLDLIQAAAIVCNEGKVDGAGAYTGEGPHAVVVGKVNNSHDYFAYGETSLLPRGWWPNEVEELELVICMKKDKVVAKHCSYTGGMGYTVYQHKVELQLFEAKSGKLISRETFRGSLPSTTCPEILGSGDDVSKTGSPVSSMRMNFWIEEFIISQVRASRKE